MSYIWKPLLLVTLIFGVSIALLLPQQPQTEEVDALWVAQKESVMKLDLSDNSVLLEILSVDDVKKIALDDSRALVWVFTQNQLLGFNFEGDLLFSVPGMPVVEEDPELKDSKNPAMAVNRETGTLWLGLNEELFQFDSDAELLNLLLLPDKAKALSVDTIAELAWVATKETLSAYDEAGSLDHFLQLEDGADIKDIAVDLLSGEIWVSSKYRLRRIDAQGTVFVDNVVEKIKLIISDPDGGAWLSKEEQIVRIDSSGTTLFEVTPFTGKGGKAKDLILNSLDGDLWVAAKEKVAQLSATGDVLQVLEFLDPGKIGKGGKLGKGNIKGLALFVDVIPPEIAFTAPAEGALINESQPQLELSFSDLGGGIDPNSLDLQVGGAPLNATCTPDLVAKTISCLPTTNFSEGLIDLSATIVDLNGNISAEAQLTFTVDTIPP